MYKTNIKINRLKLIKNRIFNNLNRHLNFNKMTNRNFFKTIKTVNNFFNKKVNKICQTNFNLTKINNFCNKKMNNKQN